MLRVAQCRLSVDIAASSFQTRVEGAWVSWQTVWVTLPSSFSPGIRTLEAQLLQNVNHTDCPELLTCLKPLKKKNFMSYFSLLYEITPCYVTPLSLCVCCILFLKYSFLFKFLVIFIYLFFIQGFIGVPAAAGGRENKQLVPLFFCSLSRD